MQTLTATRTDPRARLHPEIAFCPLPHLHRDELRAAWAIFTPLLHEVDAGRLPVHPYPYGSRGPAEADELRARAGFVKNAQYTWTTVSHGKGGGGGSGGGNGGSSGARL